MSFSLKSLAGIARYAPPQSKLDVFDPTCIAHRRNTAKALKVKHSGLFVYPSDSESVIGRFSPNLAEFVPLPLKSQCSWKGPIFTIYHKDSKTQRLKGGFKT
jgi:hypothetical protein